MIVDEIELMRQLKNEVGPVPADVSGRARMVLRAAMAVEENVEAPSPDRQRAHRGPQRRRSIRGWRPRRLVVAVAGVVTLAAGGGIAAAAVLAGNPTPQQAANIYQHWYPDNGAGRTPSTRPPLNAELVLCDYRGVTGFTTGASGGVTEGFASSAPLTDPLTAQMLVNACGTDRISGATVPSSTPATICVTTAPDAATYSEPAGWPVVVFGDATCASSGDGPAPADLMAQVNQRRNLEVAIDTVPQVCPTETQALTWVHQQLTKLDTKLPIWIKGGGDGGTCWLPTVQWTPAPGATRATTPATSNINTPTVQVGPTQYPATNPPGGQTFTTIAPNPPPAG